MVATSKDLQAMKKMMKNLMLVAAAAMGFTACQSGLDEITMRPTEPEKVTISIVASEAEESRTAINEATQSFVWSEGDKIKVIENSTAVDSDAAVIDDNGLATFTASFTAAEGDGTFTYNALYPYSAYVSIKTDETTIRSNTPSIQNATATSFDPKADLLIAKPIEATQTEATPLNMQFKRLVAIGKMTFKNLPADTIDAVTFTAPNKVLAGRSSFNYTTGQVIEYGYSSYGESSTTINYAEAIAANNAVFFTCLPCEIVAEETFTVSAVCGDKTYTRTVTMPEGRSLLFTEGDLTTFSVDMTDATVEESFKFEDGAYVIMASNNGVYYALSNVDSGASTKRLKSVTVEYDGSGSFMTTDETLVWNIKAVEDGYTIQDTNNKYIGWTSGNSSFVGDTSYSCTITPVDGGLYKIGLVKDSNRFLARNATAANEYFAFYGNTQWNELYIVPFVLDTRPSFTISYTMGGTTTELNTNDKYNFDAAGGELYVDATRENGLTADITAKLDEECDWLHLEEDEVGDIFCIEAYENDTTEARSANITFSAEGCEDVVVTIHQATDYVAPITVQEFLDAADTSTTYQLTGKITRVVNTTFGNFDLTDATGTVYIYGLLTPEGTAQAQWAAAGLKEGDIITIKGVYSEYNSAAQIKNAIYVTHQAITVDKDAIQFEVAGGSESVNVSLLNSSDTISASCDNTHFGVAVSGNVVTITAPTNDTSEAQNGTVTITAGELSATVAVSQSRDTGDVTLLTDILNNAFTGVSGTSYTAWSGSGSESSAVYAGQSAGSNSSIQLRSKNSNSGIVTTTSGGKVRKVVVTWNASTANGRTLDIYGSNTAYTSPTDLYNTSTQGTKLGSIVCGTSTELEITGDYAYIGLRSNKDAMYLAEIQISWEN